MDLQIGTGLYTNDCPRNSEVPICALGQQFFYIFVWKPYALQVSELPNFRHGDKTDNLFTLLSSLRTWRHITYSPVSKLNVSKETSNLWEAPKYSELQSGTNLGGTLETRRSIFRNSSLENSIHWVELCEILDNFLGTVHHLGDLIRAMTRLKAWRLPV